MQNSVIQKKQNPNDFFVEQIDKIYEEKSENWYGNCMLLMHMINQQKKVRTQFKQQQENIEEN